MYRNIMFLGGDKRLVYLAKLFEQEEYTLSSYALDMEEDNSPNSQLLISKLKECATIRRGLEKADVIIGPVPFSKDGSHLYIKNGIKRERPIELSDMAKEFCEGQILFGGNIPKAFRKTLEERGVFCQDYMEMADVAVENAAATAEGSIAEAIVLSVCNLCQSNCLVLGFGKCGKVLAQRLQGMGAKVSVAARRKEQLAEGKAQGCRTLKLEELDGAIAKFDFVFNTIPAMILDLAKIKQMKKEAIIIDIASGAGGTDFHACLEAGIKAKLVPGIPGKYAPKTSADILFQATQYILKSGEE